MLRNLFHYPIDFLFPQACCFCGSLGASLHPLCSICIRSLQPVASLDVTLTKKRCMRIYAGGVYVDGLKRLVLRKYVRDYIASYELARIISLNRAIPCARYDFFIPIPLYWTRKMWRGYNQAELIACELSSLFNVPVCYVLERIRYTTSQMGLSLEQRSRNVSKAFMLDTRYVSQLKGKRIALIDDVYTTGSTVQEAARALLPARPATIDVIVAARAV